MSAKTDNHKLRMDLIRPEMVVALATALQSGLEKYPKDGYLKETIETYEAALLRHFYQRSLEGIDSDSHLPHSWHLLACAAIIVSLEEPPAPWLLAKIRGSKEAKLETDKYFLPPNCKCAYEPIKSREGEKNEL